MTNIIKELETIIAARKRAGLEDEDTSASYTATLLNDEALAAAKLDEEAGELVAAFLGREDNPALIHEAADLFYHLLVLLGARGVAWDEIETALLARRGQSGLAEKASRKKEKKEKQ